MGAKHNSSGVSMMTFRAFKKVDFKEANLIKGSEYAVMLNPDDFKRTFSILSPPDDTIGSKGKEGKEQGFAPETYNFTLIFDGTGIVDSKRRDVKAEIDSFLQTVYMNPDNNRCSSFIEMIYCGEVFHCKLDSLSIDYQLLNRDGTPLRAKLTCKMSSVMVKEEPSEAPKPPAETKVVSVNDDQGKVCVCDSFDQTLNQAKENDQDSLYLIQKMLNVVKMVKDALQ